VVRPSNDIGKRERLMEWFKNQYAYYKKALPIGIPMYLGDLKWSWNTYINNLTALGIYLTFGYTKFMVDMLGANVISWIQSKVVSGNLNEIGDFLAGLFGPVAFGWLIIGYLMQNIELKNSVLEANSTNRLNESQFIFNKAIKEYEIKKEHNANQPLFSILTTTQINLKKDKTVFVVTLRFKNHGHTVINVRSGALYKGFDDFIGIGQENHFDTVSHGGGFNVHFDIQEEFFLSSKLFTEKGIIGEFSIDFIDGLKVPQSIIIEIISNKNNGKRNFEVDFMNSTKPLPIILDTQLKNHNVN